MKGRQGDHDKAGVNGYQVFEVCGERCQVLFVTIIRGKGITRGRIKDWLYSPDPYVTVQILGTPNGAKKTRHVPNTSDPEWNETLDEFYIDPKRDHLIEFVLYDLNRTVNEEIGREVFDFYGFSSDTDNNIVISFKNGSKIEVKLRHQINDSAQSMRFGLDLCSEEKVYRQQRRPKVLAGLSAFLGNKDDNPQSVSECPNICLMTSGGGFRAMIAFCGVYKAMEDVGLIDCVTYTSALSGSSWYLATLYTHPDYPHEPKVSHKIKPEIRKCVEKYWQVHLSPPWSSKYLRKIITKGINGQPVSFTDFYGYLVGQQLLKGRMKARLSDQGNKIKDGTIPFPMYTCLHVKSNVSAKIFQEWYEFTPYEVSIPKYGVNIKTSDFASKFFMGEKIKSFPEVRLHFLYGIWGSAFTIQFKRLMLEKGRNGHGEVLKMVHFTDDPSNDETKDEAEDANDFIVRCLDPEVVKELSTNENQAQKDEDIMIDCDDDPKMIISDNDDEIIEEHSNDDRDLDHEIKNSNKHQNNHRRRSMPRLRSLRNNKNKTSIPQSKTTCDFQKSCENELPDTNRLENLEEDRSKWNQFLEKALTTSPIDSRAFRAGVIWNPLRGLTFNPNPLHTNATSDDDDFKDFLKCMETDEKKIYLVDSGLSFNLPFPVTLRPQRGIELYITCDFSSRKSDSTPPFRELLLAEKWAILHKLPFPPVREIAKEKINQPIQECYVFKDPANNPEVPVVILFTLVNKDFRNFKSPNVPRETEEEKSFADFDIFDNTNAYAIWRFVYPNQSFDRLTAMMEFNILNNQNVIRSEIADIVRRKKVQAEKVA